MSTFNLSMLKVVETSNKRTSTGGGSGRATRADYQLRYNRKAKVVDGKEEITSKFTLAKELFIKLNLENYGLKELASPDKSMIALAVVAEEDAKLFKGRQKDGVRMTKALVFNANVLEADLISAGILKDELGDQFINLEKIEGSDNADLDGLIAVGGVYGLVVGSGSVGTFPKKDAVADNVTSSTVNATSATDPTEVEEEEEEFEEEIEDDL